MTRVKLFGALGVVAIAIGGIAFLPRGQGNTQASKSKIEAVGLTRYGLDLIAPNHPAFSKLMSANKPGPVSPYSVFVVNNSEQAVISCSLKWEIVSIDGQISTRFQTKVDAIETVYEGGRAHLIDGIAAKGSLAFSLLDHSNPDNSVGSGFGIRMGGGSPNIAAQLSNSVKVTVSVDGVLFADGLYVGPDANSFFELFRGEVEGNRDLAGEVDRMVGGGATPEAIANHLKKVSHTPLSEVQAPTGEHSYYSFGKWTQRKLYAIHLLVTRDKKGDQALLELVRGELSKPQVELRKLKEN